MRVAALPLAAISAAAVAAMHFVQELCARDSISAHIPSQGNSFSEKVAKSCCSHVYPAHLSMHRPAPLCCSRPCFPVQLRRGGLLQPKCWLLLLLPRPLALGCRGALCSRQLPAQICHVHPHLLQLGLLGLGQKGSLGLLQKAENCGAGSANARTHVGVCYTTAAEVSTATQGVCSC